MSPRRKIETVPSDEQIRSAMLRYFYDRNKNATSLMGKRGSAVRISDLKSELKTAHGFTQQQVQSNLTYLLSQGWVDEKREEKKYTPPGGSVVTSATRYYIITAAGIDKIDGPGEFTMDKFHGIKIEATGQNIITLGDGNQVDAKFGEIGQALAELRTAITDSEADESTKLTYVAEIETIQSQLAKPEPNRNIIKEAWETLKATATINGCISLVGKVAGLISQFV